MISYFIGPVKGWNGYDIDRRWFCGLQLICRMIRSCPLPGANRELRTANKEFPDSKRIPFAITYIKRQQHFLSWEERHRYAHYCSGNVKCPVEIQRAILRHPSFWSVQKRDDCRPIWIQSLGSFPGKAVHGRDHRCTRNGGRLWVT